ncbi:hypothetical protein [Chroococcus sp. FPU101]|uniref:hypothetical protein n=1 Tax=Chroococcus sp. FPU101 TaxID=1974212 RepID=UPI001A8F7C3A|nr:hypothetical protein [Chroococcus sp. FPU101]GFE71758.1 hypothetical protein CFPU101_43680 [Chroococcus sp. FPU101]
MISWKKLIAGLLAFVSTFIFTFNYAAPVKAASLTDASEIVQKYSTQLTEIKAGYDELAPLFKEGAWDQVDKTLPGLNKSFRSLVSSLAKKAPPELQESLGPIAADVTSYFDELETAKGEYKTAKSSYKKAESSYQKEVESGLDKIDDSLDALLKFLPKAPKTPKA